MKKNSIFIGAMEAVNHVKNSAMVGDSILKHRRSSTSHKSRIIFLFALAVLLLPVVLSAQIRMAGEKTAQPEKQPAWWSIKEQIFAPYDSSYYHVGWYPALDAYKKYVGQQLFLPSIEQAINTTLLYAVDTFIYVDPYTKRHITHFFYQYRLKNYLLEEHNNDRSAMSRAIINRRELGRDISNSPDIINRYYTIIDVISANSDEFLNSRPYEKPRFAGTGWDTEDDFISADYLSKDDIPFFVLQDAESGDTVYTAFPRKYFILVGGFVRMQQKHIGQKFVETASMPSLDDVGEIANWECIDVVLATERRDDIYTRKDERGRSGVYPDRAYDTFYVNLIFQNADKKIEIDDNRIGITFWKKKVFDRMLEGFAAEKKAKQEMDRQMEINAAAHKAQLEQKRIAYRQDLINRFGEANAQNILADKFVIGMSKEMCAEVSISAVVTEQTAVSEIWLARNGYGHFFYLYFVGNKLVKIVDPLNPLL